MYTHTRTHTHTHAAAKHPHTCTHIHMCTLTHEHRHTHTQTKGLFGPNVNVPRLRSSLLDCALTSSGRTVKARLPDRTPEFLVPQVWVGHEACSSQGWQMLLAHTDEWEELILEGNSPVFLPFPVHPPQRHAGEPALWRRAANKCPLSSAMWGQRVKI